MIITELAPFKVKVSEGQLLKSINENRDALMSVLVGVLNEMVAYLKEVGLPERK